MHAALPRPAPECGVSPLLGTGCGWISAATPPRTFPKSESQPFVEVGTTHIQRPVDTCSGACRGHPVAPVLRGGQVCRALSGPRVPAGSSPPAPSCCKCSAVQPLPVLGPASFPPGVSLRALLKALPVCRTQRPGSQSDDSWYQAKSWDANSQMGVGAGDLPAGAKEEAITGGRRGWMLGVGAGAARGWAAGSGCGAGSPVLGPHKGRSPGTQGVCGGKGIAAFSTSQSENHSDDV